MLSLLSASADHLDVPEKMPSQGLQQSSIEEHAIAALDLLTSRFDTCRNPGKTSFQPVEVEDEGLVELSPAWLCS